MSAHREEFLDLCAGHALGTLGEDDRLRLEAHLAEGCATCESALADFSDTTVLVASSVAGPAPSAALRERVLEAARRERRPVAARGTVIELPARRVPWLTWTWAAAAALLAVSSVTFWNQAEELRRRLGENRTALAQLGQRAAEDRKLIEVLSAPAARVAEMQITPAGVAELKARAVYDPRTRAAVIVFDHFTAPSGRDYQLWALRGAGVASLGVIHADADGHAVVRFEDVGDPATLGGFAVSLEPAGGSPFPDKPTGPVVMAGKFGG